MGIKVKGINQVKSNMQKTFSNISGEVTRGGLQAFVSQLAAYASELTPVDTANLINSQYTFVNPNGDNWKAGVGYTANYAEEVHDGPDKNWQKAGASNMFLTDAADRNSSQLLKTLKDNHRRA